jgi:hypothetical protein
MTKASTKNANAAPAYEADAFYAVRFSKVVDLGDMKLRPAHDYPSIAGSLLAQLPPDAIQSATKLSDEAL